MKGNFSDDPAMSRTTKDPAYIQARAKLDDPSAEINVLDLALVLGVHENTARKWAKEGRYGAHRHTPNAAYRFDINEIRAELGLPPLSD